MAERTCTHPEIRIHLAFSLGDSAIFAEMALAFDRNRFRLTSDKVQVQVVLTGLSPIGIILIYPANGSGVPYGTRHSGQVQRSCAPIRKPDVIVSKANSLFQWKAAPRARNMSGFRIGVRRCLTCPE
jgi:hypothetical protein